MASRRIWERSCPGRWVWVQRWRHGFWPATTGVHGQNKSRVTLVKNSTGWFSWVPPLLLVGKHLLYSFGVVAVWLYQIDQHQNDGDEKAKCRRNPIPVFRHPHRSEEHTSELQSLMRISYAVFCLKKKKKKKQSNTKTIIYPQHT